VGAGFGVTAFSQLNPGFCAFKNEFSSKTLKKIPEAVVFQGGISDRIITWVKESDHHGGILNYLASYVEAFISSPGGIVKNSNIRVTIEKSGDNDAIVRISGSGEFDDVIFSAPESKISSEEFRNIIIPKGGTEKTKNEIGTIRNFDGNEELGDKTSILTSDIPLNSNAVRIYHSGTDRFGYDFYIKHYSKLGKKIVIIGRISQAFGLRNDIDL